MLKSELTGRKLKRDLGLKRAMYRYQNKNNTGGNFGINLMAGDTGISCFLEVSEPLFVVVCDVLPVVAQGEPHAVFRKRCSCPCTHAGCFRKAGQYDSHSYRENPGHEKSAIRCRGSSATMSVAIIRRRDRDDWWARQVIVRPIGTLMPVRD